MKTTKKVSVSDLKIDEKFTQIRHINPVFVNRYRQDYRNGDIFPLIIVQQRSDDTFRVVSGNTRTTALKEEYGDDHIVEVEIREYQSEAEVLVDFLKENRTHGNPLDNFTKRKLTRAMIDEGMTVEEIAKAFNYPVRKIEKLGEGVIAVRIGHSVQDLPIKKGFEPPSQKPISRKQYDDHAKMDRGFTVCQQTSQLVRWLKNGFIDYSDKNVEALSQLRDALNKYFEKQKVA